MSEIIEKQVSTNGSAKATNGSAKPTNGSTKPENSPTQAFAGAKAEGPAHVEGHKVVLDKKFGTDVVEETVIVEKKGLIRRILPFVFLAALMAGAIYGWNLIQFNKVHETTDDAQVDADISPIVPRIAGYVTSILVNDNDHVTAGTLLVTLDQQDLAMKIQAAQAALANSEAAVRGAQAAASASKANISAAEVAMHKTAADLERDRVLLKGNAVTQEQYDAARAAAETAQAQYAALQDQASASLSQVGVAEAVVAQRKSDLANAQLQQSYTAITSPATGTVSKKNVEIGQYVQAGQPLMAVASPDVWITANFKETQIGRIHQGQPVEFSADAYPGVTFHGTVQSVSPATGAKFALLPPDNASGNFVKVTQRIPVKILVNGTESAKHPLRPGMSVDVTISTAK